MPGAGFDPAERRSRAMVYDAYQFVMDALAPSRAFAEFAAGPLGAFNTAFPALPFAWGGAAAEAYSLFAFTHERPDFAIGEVETRGERVPVRHEVSYVTPFCKLTRFVREGGQDDPRVLLIAPMSGHFAALCARCSRISMSI